MLMTFRPHTLPASSLYLSHFGGSLKDHDIQLTSRMQALQEENARLFAQISQQRKEIDQVVASLETVVSDLDESVATLTHDEMLALTNDTMAIDNDAQSAG